MRHDTIRLVIPHDKPCRKPYGFLLLLVIPNDMSEEKRVTFRADPEKIDRLDKEIMRAKLNNQLSDEVSRSDLLRLCVDTLIEDLETEGNSNSKILV